jgi:tRNA A22 N-methylase
LALQGDGLFPLREFPVDAVVIAGIGAELMLRVLGAVPEVMRHVQQLIVQPNQSVHLLREWALENGWHLRDERLLQMRRRFFVVCAFVPRAGDDPAYDIPGWDPRILCRVGPLLLARGGAVTARWYEQQSLRAARWATRNQRLASELTIWEAARAQLARAQAAEYA